MTSATPTDRRIDKLIQLLVENATVVVPGPKIAAEIGVTRSTVWDWIEKLRGLGWRAQTRFSDGLERTVEWYRENEWWWEPIRSGAYRDYYERQYGTALK